MKSSEQKRAMLLELAKRRQADCLPPHASLADFHEGYYECDYVSPWSISACNVDSALMLIGQDWASSDVLNRPRDERRRTLGQDPESSTNKNLPQLLKSFDIKFSDTYATNLFPFIKQGPKSAEIQFADLVRCGKQYALPQIEIISPRLVICLGKSTFRAVRRAAGLPDMKWEDARLPSPHTQVGLTAIYGLPHPGRLGTINAGGMDAVLPCWQALAAHFRP